ncbi:MAG: hypothetical protein V3T22_12225, partial [Planctomycetota bacterium]
LEVHRLSAPARVEVQAFLTTDLRRAGRLFQGHHEVQLTGEWENVRRRLPIATLVIRSDQRWARVAAQLLEPHSEDSLSTWNFFAAGSRSDTGAADGRGAQPVYPVLRLESLAGLVLAGD